MAALLTVTVALWLFSAGQALGIGSVFKTADIFLTTPQSVTKHGYPVETHTVPSGSGYLLVLHRIPGSPKNLNSSIVKPPVLMHHGVACASDLWVCTGPDKALGFLLADQGYDVWLANARGNYYSRKHVVFTPNDAEFWNFTWHEMGANDLPGIIDYILAETGQPQIFFVGHSMGCVTFFVMASTRPQYNAKIRLMVGLAPAVYNGQTGSFSDSFARLVVSQGGNEVLTRTTTKDWLLDFLCKDGRTLHSACKFFFFNTYGYNDKELNATLLPVFMSNFQAGTSINTVKHFIQIFQTGRFQTFDTHAKRGQDIGNTTLYNLQLVTAPVALYYGMNDVIIRPSGVLRLSRELPNVVKLTKVPDEEASHSDLIFANHVKQLVYDDVIDLMRLY